MSPLATAVWTLFSNTTGRTGQRFRLHSPEGRLENSPPFQGWDPSNRSPSPEGTTESRPKTQKWPESVSKLRRQEGRRSFCAEHIGEYELTYDMNEFSRPFETSAIAALNPAANCRAILNSPFGRGSPRNVQTSRAGVPPASSRGVPAPVALRTARHGPHSQPRRPRYHAKL